MARVEGRPVGVDERRRGQHLEVERLGLVDRGLERLDPRSGDRELVGIDVEAIEDLEDVTRVRDLVVAGLAEPAQRALGDVRVRCVGELLQVAAQALLPPAELLADHREGHEALADHEDLVLDLLHVHHDRRRDHGKGDGQRGKAEQDPRRKGAHRNLHGSLVA